MELTWANKGRIAAVAALGIIVIGFLAWPLAAPEDPLAPVRSSSFSFLGTLILLTLAFAVGFVGYFASWPHGREIGILAVPFGLAAWLIRSGPMQTLRQAYTTAETRQALLDSLRFEPVFWLIVVITGFAGVLVAQHLRPGSGTPVTLSRAKSYLRPNLALAGAAALLIGALVAHFFIGVFAQDLSASYPSAVTQPAIGQIAMAGIAAFAVAGFLVKKLFDLSYIWATVAAALVIPFSYVLHSRSDTVEKFAEMRPATFYPHAVFAISPLQMIALGALGAVLGYWIAVRYDYWRKHEAGA